MRSLRCLIFKVIIIPLMCIPAFQISALVIKVGTLAPEGSPWDKALKRIAAEWHTISGGRITMKIYGGGVAGDEPDIIRKMRINQLQAGGMTGIGMGEIHPDFLVYQLPFMAETDDELDYLFNKLRPRLEKLLEEKGFTFLAYNKSGWLHFFSKTEVSSPDDVRRLKFFSMEGQPEIDQAWKSMGFHVVPLPTNDVFAALQSGMVEIFTASPLTAAAMQWFAVAPHMTDFHFGPLTGCLIITNQAWKEVPTDMRTNLQTATQKILNDLYYDVMEVEDQAIKIMKENGLVIHHVSKVDYKKWEEIVDTGFRILMGNFISRDIYEEARGYLEEYRKSTAR